MLDSSSAASVPHEAVLLTQDRQAEDLIARLKRLPWLLCVEGWFLVVVFFSKDGIL